MTEPVAGRPPSVDFLARKLADTGLPHPVLVDLARRAIAEAADGAVDGADQPDPVVILEAARRAALTYTGAMLQPVINATGVLLHTNLGRAPLPVSRPEGYTNLELDLGTGRRGDRSAHAASLLARACGAEAALVVNNGAAAVLLALSALAAGRDVVVSRGELVEIGGGFRIPEVLAQSGARLVEVGTTNRTRLSDYRDAVGEETSVVLKVHTSNYAITGFTESVDVSDLTRLGLPVVVDLGSGLLDSRCQWLAGGPPDWLADEPAAAQTLAAGAGLVTFSGDKLLGGPQAGVIAGRRDMVDRCRRHPLARALRPGGLVLETLQQVALSYLRRDAGVTVPLWRMATTPVEDLRRRAGALGAGEPVDCRSVMGGGTLPSTTIPSAGIALDGDLTARLRAATPPVIAHVKEGRTICDLRTVLPEQDPDLAKAVNGALP
ncbi:MAG TPA: L-seryl-tRNA(Sec) selenium transferase [Acidimicrobiales bacterium]|nr:L-seryl-tRNA(Sec) selenium transferase [Acidimicrobiales bacterium]